MTFADRIATSLGLCVGIIAGSMLWKFLVRKGLV